MTVVPDAMAVVPDAGLPAGFMIKLDAGTRQLDRARLFGGSPARLMRLSAPGRAAFAELQAGPITSHNAGLLARRLTDAGLAHPQPKNRENPDVVVVIPVRDRADDLAVCLHGLGYQHRVLVIDDGSTDPEAIAAACPPGIRLLRLDINGGPAAARNAGLAHSESEFVAFLDSDCVASADWISSLAGHFDDPTVAAVAPRIVGRAGPNVAGRYTRARGSLDLGAQAGRVMPLTRVSYVPTAALIVRRSALLAVGDFDPALRVGEDVDLIWRLHKAGWRVRYEPTVEVAHREPRTWPGLLRRRFQYGTSAGALARRHPDCIPPLVLYPWPTATVFAVLARRPVLAAVAATLLGLSTRRALRKAGLDGPDWLAAALESVRQTWLGLGRYGTQFGAPALLALLLTRSGRKPAASLLLGPALSTWLKRRPQLDPIRFTLACVADDFAYGAGVWAGAWRGRTAVPLCPKLVPHWSI